MKIIAITSALGVGGTFVDWSLHFLSGQSRYFSVADQSWIDLVDQALTHENAHQHKRNHPLGIDKVDHYIKMLSQTPHELHSFYMLDDYFESTVNAPTTQLIEKCHSHQIPVVYLHVPQHLIGYAWRKRNGITVDNNSDVALWDQREQLALDFRPFDTSVLIPDIATTDSTVWIHCEQLWQSPELVLREIMSKLSVTVVESRYSQWCKQADQWRQMQLSYTKFVRELDHIVAAIVNGWSHPLDRLTLTQEAVIQHCLIYQHNLNIKSWGLDHFPNNTQLLHQLLETNHHLVKNY